LFAKEQVSRMLKGGRYIDVSDRSIVSLLGSESLDLLQRISTNDVAKLIPDGAVQTVLANEKGRIIEVASVLHYGREGLLVVGHSTDPLIMKKWLEKYIIMEDITVTMLTGKLTHLMIYDSPQDMRNLNRPFSPSNWQIFEETLGSSKLIHVLVATEDRDNVMKWLKDLGFVQKEIVDYEEYRVACGIPGFPGEFSASYNPLEAGLLHLVSFTKGCYIGQEVVARLDTYKKVQRRLMRLKMLDLPANLPEKIYFEGEECGSITSALCLRDSHECLGLGYVKTDSGTSSEGLYFHNGANKIKLVGDSRSAEAG
jgi:tRNA-modifying protein YgfZ